jgi:hypothetical protein
MLKEEGGRSGDTFSLYQDSKRYRIGNAKSGTHAMLFLTKTINDFDRAYELALQLPQGQILHPQQ